MSNKKAMNHVTSQIVFDSIHATVNGHGDQTSASASVISAATYTPTSTTAPSPDIIIYLLINYNSVYINTTYLISKLNFLL